MLSNPVKGFSGSCLNELGDCACVIQASQALSAEEVDDVYYLVFSSTFVILAVGPSLSGYEMRVSTIFFCFDKKLTEQSVKFFFTASNNRYLSTISIAEHFPHILLFLYLQSNFPLSTVSIKKGQHSEHWPWPVEILHRQETIHASLSSEKDLINLIECVGRQEGVPNRVSGMHSYVTLYIVSVYKHMIVTKIKINCNARKPHPYALV